MKFKIQTLKKPSFKIVPLALMVGAISQAHAVSFDFADGEVNARINTSLSTGISISTQDPDKDLLPTAYGGRAGGINANDGKQNFKSGDVISNIFKGSTDLSINYQNVGAFVRAKYWYDHGLENKEGRFKELDDSGFDELAKFSGATIMDAYLWAELELFDSPIDVRLGRQVVNWGESTFIQGGINVINPVDANAISRPGVEIKEALLPVNMLSLAMGLTENLSAEAFFQLEYQNTVLPGCGTFFAGTDAIQPGCGPLFAVSGLTEEQQSDMSLVNPALPSSANMIIQKEGEDKPKGDQFGISFKYFSEALNSTEFGFYYLNYHSRLPYTSAITADYDDRPGNGFFLNGITNNPAYGNAAIPFVQGPKYIVDYPESIELYGLSFNTSGPFGSSLGGEISHRPEMPLQINGQDFLYATGFLDTESPIVEELFGINLPQAGAGPLVAKAAGLYGQKVEGYRTKPVTQVQATLIQTIPDFLAAGRLVLVAELGMQHIADLEDPEVIKYGRSATYGSGVEGVAIACKNADVNESYCSVDGYVTDFSWGYRIKSNLTYSNVFSGVNVSPGLVFKHDVQGYSAAPGAQFIEGRKAITLSTNLDYQGTYNVNVSYTDFFDGKYNTKTDRDFVALSAGMKF